MELGILFSQALIALFMAFCCYGAYLLVSDSEKRWKERYGNRWFVSKSEKERLDKAYAERKAAQKVTRAASYRLSYRNV